MTQVVLAFLSVAGALVGVMLGSVLNARVQRASWQHQENTMSKRERRVTYAAFVAACREWQATVPGPDVPVPEPFIQACRDAEREFQPDRACGTGQSRDRSGDPDLSARARGNPAGLTGHGTAALPARRGLLTVKKEATCRAGTSPLPS